MEKLTQGHKSALIVSVLLLLIVGTEFIYRNPLFDQTSDFIKSIQKKTPDWGFSAWSLFSESGDSYTVLTVIILFNVWFTQRKRTIYYCLMISAELFVMNITKMLYKQERPNWIEPSLYKGEGTCSANFGNPSGHSLLSSVMAFTLALDFGTQFSQQNPARKRLYMIGLVAIAAVYSIAMAFSRLVIGIHSLNQVVYGWLLGLWLALLLHLLARSFIFSRVESYLSVLGEGNKTFMKDALVLLIVTVAVLGIQIAVYLYVDSTDPVNASWVANLNRICEDFVSSEEFHHDSFESAGYTLMFSGAYLGMLIQARFIRGQTYIQYPSKHAQIKAIGRFVLVLLIFMPFLGWVFVAEFESRWLNMFLVKGLGSGLGFVVVTSVLDWVCFKLKLYDEAVIQGTVSKVIQMARKIEF